MSEAFLSTPGGRLKSARERLGLSLADAAKKCGVGRQSLWDLESGKRSATLDRLWGIATALEIDPAELDPRLASNQLKRKNR